MHKKLRKAKATNILPLKLYCEATSASDPYMHLFYADASRRPLLAALQDQAARDSELHTWSRRLQILVGVSRALHAIHTHAGVTLRSLSTSNVFIDESYEPSLLVYTHQMATETQPNTAAAAVHDFGLLILSLITGRLPHAWLPQGDQAASQSLDYETTLKVLRQAVRSESGSLELESDGDLAEPWPQPVVQDLLRVALDCTQENVHRRPTPHELFEEMEGRVGKCVVSCFIGACDGTHHVSMGLTCCGAKR